MLSRETWESSSVAMPCPLRLFPKNQNAKISQDELLLLRSGDAGFHRIPEQGGDVWAAECFDLPDAGR